MLTKRLKNYYIYDDRNFYSKIRRYSYKKNGLFHFQYKKLDITNDSILHTMNFSSDMILKIQCIHILNIKDLYQRYLYIYDSVYNFLENEFRKKNYCGFKNNICNAQRDRKECNSSINGCCYGKNRGLCKYFVENKCIIQCLPCKLFTCKYLRKQKIKYKPNDFPLIKYFLNIRQKKILETTFFCDKDIIINLLIKNR